MSSSDCARTLIGQFLAQGVTDFVLCPGSRSAPLALCLEATARAGRLRLHVRVDERSAGFLALGLAKSSGRPVVVVTTSGTAVGNLMPAVMEAFHGGVPVVVVSADRPSWTVGVGANQTTQQVGIFARFVLHDARMSAAAPPPSWAAQAARAVLLASGATGGWRGPVHLNVELSEPLVEAGEWIAVSMRPVRSGFVTTAELATLSGSPRTVVVCGDATPAVGAEAAALAERAALPLIAEPSSNARSGVTALATGRLLLATGLGEQIERVLVYGHPTLSRPVNALLARSDVEVVVVTDRSDYVDPGWHASLVVGAVEVEPGPPEWLAEWQQADRARSAVVARVAAATGPLTGPQLADLVVASVPPTGVLCIGNSNAVRDADLASAFTPAACYANRGLAGIDGTVSTAVGVAVASARPTTLLCGDLSFAHDLAGLVIGSGEPRPDLRIVVADDGGGSIFATLEYGRADFAEAFERVFATPTGLDLAAVAAGYGVPVKRLRTVEEVTAALAEPITDLAVLVVDVDRTQRAELARRLAQG